MTKYRQKTRARAPRPYSVGLSRLTSFLALHAYDPESGLTTMRVESTCALYAFRRIVCWGIYEL